MPHDPIHHKEPLHASEQDYSPQVLEQLRRDAAEVISRYPQPRSALLPLLHLVQSVDGYVTGRGVRFCAEQLDLSAAEVSGVATFYTQYKRHPNGDYTVGVCTNTLCAIMGGDQIYEEVSDHLGVGHDETTPDGKVTLERVECNAACDYAPVVMVNWEFFDNQTPETTKELVDRLRRGETVTPSRGPSRVCDFRHISRVLAGFDDGLADEGPGAGGPSLEGLRIAQEQGWRAPSPQEAADDEPDDTRSDVEPEAGEQQSSADTPANAPGERPESGGGEPETGTSGRDTIAGTDADGGKEGQE
ncbi:NADH-quinone oxidoreductase subunit NuoE [Ornithinicoccus halotolerans]|uniref:NADH-quinone oxidoreductase subunit NuoE n=1 Tax=Ornithinicoccus halotolerans TaxID=1748220 RepID=UPI0012971D54